MPSEILFVCAEAIIRANTIKLKMSSINLDTYILIYCLCIGNILSGRVIVVECWEVSIVVCLVLEFLVRVKSRL